MPNCRLWNAGSLLSSSMICFRIGALLQLLEHQHLVLVRVVDAGLAGGDALAGDDHRLHALQELIVAIDAGRRRDDDAAGAAVDGDHRPRGKRRGRQRQQESRNTQTAKTAKSHSTHHPSLRVIVALRPNRAPA